MRHLEHHANVIQLYGCCTEAGAYEKSQSSIYIFLRFLMICKFNRFLYVSFVVYYRTDLHCDGIRTPRQPTKLPTRQPTHGQTHRQKTSALCTHHARSHRLRSARVSGHGIHLR